MKDGVCEGGIDYLKGLAAVLLPKGVGKTQMNIIAQNHPGNVGACFTAFFNVWDDREVDASWQKLIDALVETNKDKLAERIKNLIKK